MRREQPWPSYRVDRRAEMDGVQKALGLGILTPATGLAAPALPVFGVPDGARRST